MFQVKIIALLMLVRSVQFCGGVDFLSPGPSFVVAGQNQHALVDCTLDTPFSDFLISEFITDTTGNVIYLGIANTTNNSDEYAVTPFYNLTVLNTSLTDGGLYKCDIVSGSNKLNYVTIMEKPNLVVTGLEESGQTTVTCSATYGSEIDNPAISSPQGPILTIFYNKTPLFNATVGSRVRNSDPGYRGNYLTPFTGTQTYSFSRNDTGNNISCAFLVQDPPFEFATTLTLNINSRDSGGTRDGATHLRLSYPSLAFFLLLTTVSLLQGK